MKKNISIPQVPDFFGTCVLTEMEHQVSKQWQEYESILLEEKECENGKVILNRPTKKKGVNKAPYKGSTTLFHPNPIYNLGLGVSQHYSRRNYNVILRSKGNFKEPLIHFDAAGPSHTNDFPEIPLEKRLVTTPHFNRFREDGRYYAYKNAALERIANVAAIVEDITLGLALFCQEAKCVTRDGNLLEAAYFNSEMEFPGTLKVNFNNIKFD